MIPWESISITNHKKLFQFSLYLKILVWKRCSYWPLSLYVITYSFLFYIFRCFIQRIGSSGQRNATRCGLWWVEMLKTRDQYKEAATVYFRISGEVMPKFVITNLKKVVYSRLLNKYIFVGTSTFCCDAGASILLLSVS